jgi:hypothetical protein
MKTQYFCFGFTDYRACEFNSSCDCHNAILVSAGKTKKGYIDKSTVDSQHGNRRRTE